MENEKFQVRTDLALEARESFQEDDVEIRGVSIEENYDEERDIMMAADAKHASMIVLSAKQFAIFTPHDAHKPLCLHKVPGNVKKVVFKIAV